MGYENAKQNIRTAKLFNLAIPLGILYGSFTIKSSLTVIDKWYYLAQGLIIISFVILIHNIIIMITSK